MPDISKMMTISTSHITKESADWLDQQVASNEFLVYAKGDYGWFIPVIRDVEIMAEAVDIAPADIVS